MKMPRFVVLLVTVLVQVSAGFPTDRRTLPSQDKRASWDDVNVVAHGLLQLGLGLKEHVDKTKVQMRDINARLNAFNGTVAELERRQQEQGEALRARTKEVEEKDRLVAELAEELRMKTEEVKKQSEDIHSRMDRLEVKVNGGQVTESDNNDSTEVSFIQRLLLAQNKRIDQLVDKIKQQQDKLEKQSLHLQALQVKVAHKKVKLHKRRDQDRALRGEAAQSGNSSGRAGDCQDLFVQGERASGVYSIQPQDSQPFNVLCEMTSEAGWTVIQKRHDGSQNFDQLWESYKRGFGSLDGEFWLGLENIHAISRQGSYILQVELTDGAGRQLPVTRYRLRLDGEEEKFSLHLEDESPSDVQEKVMPTTASGLPFSTADRDNDLAAEVNCAERLSGGWWFSSCGELNLNGRYPRRSSGLRQQQHRRRGMFWTSSKGKDYSVKSTVLKISPVRINQ